MKNQKEKIGVLILAAGNSVRMGSPKFLLKFDENKSFLQKIIEDYKAFGCAEIKVVLNKQTKLIYDENNLQLIDKEHIVINNKINSERFYSIKLGLKAFKYASSIFIHHVDNPFVEQEVLNALVSSKNKVDCIVPVYEGKGGHPILVGERIIEAIQQTIENSLHFKEFLSKFTQKRVPVITEKILVNINTFEEYKILKK